MNDIVIDQTPFSRTRVGFCPEQRVVHLYAEFLLNGVWHNDTEQGISVGFDGLKKIFEVIAP